VDDPKGEQLLSPLQAVVHAQTGVVHPVSAIVQESGVPVSPGEVRAIEAAAGAAPEGHSPGLRAGLTRAVGLEG
jgi:hypothetical protein